jgi:hypothetical protein
LTISPTPSRAPSLAARPEVLSLAIGALRVPFGLRAGRLYEPLQVKGGLECGCTCPGCGARLVARHSPSGRVASNFAHHAGADCASGFETAVHLAAKRLIADRMTLFLPSVVARVPGTGIRGKDHGREVLLAPAGVRNLDDVRVEEDFGPIRPDLVVAIEGQEVLVEIAVTHFVDEAKLAFIQAIGLPALEIDLSELRAMNFEALENALFTDSQKAQWLWHPEREQERARLQALVDADLVLDKESRATGESLPLFEDAEEDEAGRADLLRRRETAQREYLLHRSRKPEVPALEFGIPATTESEHLRKALSLLGTDEARLREVLPVHVTPTRAIAAAPLVWQGAVLAGLVLRGPFSGSGELTSQEVRAWIQERFEVPGDEETSSRVLWQFLRGLEERKLLHHRGRQRFVVTVVGWPSARSLVADRREGGVVPLAWLQDWPPNHVTNRLAEVFGEMFGSSERWRPLGGLLQSVREQESPEATVHHYAKRGLDTSKVRQFFLAAGFVRLAGA